jgi:ORF6N domain-containing protein
MQLQRIETKIYEVRGQKIMLDFDLAELYETETKYLKRAVRVNIRRFPPDFMFELSKAEWETLRCNFSTSNKRGGTRYLPFAFTEQGVSMLSSVLNSNKAIDVNIAIMRAFVFIRQYALTHKDLTEKLKELETTYNKQFKDVYEAINYLMQRDQKTLRKDKQEAEQKERKKIGYK